jgi:hypothetical protein
MDKVFPPWELRNKIPVFVFAVGNAQIPGLDSLEVREQPRDPDERRDPYTYAPDF